jgi:hypothetical protein
VTDNISGMKGIFSILVLLVLACPLQLLAEEDPTLSDNEERQIREELAETLEIMNYNSKSDEEVDAEISIELKKVFYDLHQKYEYWGVQDTLALYLSFIYFYTDDDLGLTQRLNEKNSLDVTGKAGNYEDMKKKIVTDELCVSENGEKICSEEFRLMLLSHYDAIIDKLIKTGKPRTTPQRSAYQINTHLAIITENKGHIHDKYYVNKNGYKPGWEDIINNNTMEELKARYKASVEEIMEASQYGMLFYTEIAERFMKFYKPDVSLVVTKSGSKVTQRFLSYEEKHWRANISSPSYKLLSSEALCNRYGRHQAFGNDINTYSTQAKQLEKNYPLYEVGGKKRRVHTYFCPWHYKELTTGVRKQLLKTFRFIKNPGFTKEDKIKKRHQEGRNVLGRAAILIKNIPRSQASGIPTGIIEDKITREVMRETQKLVQNDYLSFDGKLDTDEEMDFYLKLKVVKVYHKVRGYYSDYIYKKFERNVTSKIPEYEKINYNPEQYKAVLEIVEKENAYDKVASVILEEQLKQTYKFWRRFAAGVSVLATIVTVGAAAPAVVGVGAGATAVTAAAAVGTAATNAQFHQAKSERLLTEQTGFIGECIKFSFKGDKSIVEELNEDKKARLKEEYCQQSFDLQEAVIHHANMAKSYRKNAYTEVIQGVFAVAGLGPAKAIGQAKLAKIKDLKQLRKLKLANHMAYKNNKLVKRASDLGKRVKDAKLTNAVINNAEDALSFLANPFAGGAKIVGVNGTKLLIKRISVAVHKLKSKGFLKNPKIFEIFHRRMFRFLMKNKKGQLKDISLSAADVAGDFTENMGNALQDEFFEHFGITLLAGFTEGMAQFGTVEIQLRKIESQRSLLNNQGEIGNVDEVENMLIRRNENGMIAINEGLNKVQESPLEIAFNNEVLKEVNYGSVAMNKCMKMKLEHELEKKVHISWCEALVHNYTEIIEYESKFLSKYGFSLGGSYRSIFNLDVSLNIDKKEILYFQFDNFGHKISSNDISKSQVALRYYKRMDATLELLYNYELARDRSIASSESMYMFELSRMSYYKKVFVLVFKHKELKEKMSANVDIYTISNMLKMYKDKLNGETIEKSFDEKYKKDWLKFRKEKFGS